MNTNLIARASTQINASSTKVWNALVNPKAIKRYMFGTDVVSDWQEGGPIVWRGEWEGKSYEDKGVILKFKPGHTLQYTHFSPLCGLPDKPEHYHKVTIELVPQGTHTRVSLAQDNNASEDARAHSEQNWGMVLDGLKRLVEH